MKHSKVMKKKLRVKAIEPLKPRNSLEAAVVGTKHSPKTDRQTNKKIITTNPDVIATRPHPLHVEVFEEDMIREMKVKEPSKPTISPGRPGQHN